MTPEPTIADLRNAGRKIEGECHACGRLKVIAPAVPLPPLATLGAAAALLKCSSCGARSIKLSAVDTTHEDHPAVQAVVTAFPGAAVTVLAGSRVARFPVPCWGERTLRRSVDDAIRTWQSANANETGPRV